MSPGWQIAVAVVVGLALAFVFGFFDRAGRRAARRARRDRRRWRVESERRRRMRERS